MNNDAISRSAVLEEIDWAIDLAMDDEMHHAMCILGERFKELPALDAVPVVRCKDCINSQLIYDADRVWCNVWREEVERNGFCHHGNATNNGVSNVPEKNVGEFGGVINAVD